MAKKYIDIEGIGQVLVRHNVRAKHACISIGPDGSLRVTLPPLVPLIFARQFVLSQKQWITQKRPITQLLKTGMPIGKLHRLNFAEGKSVIQPTSRASGNLLNINVPKNQAPSSPAVQATALKAAEKILQKESNIVLRPRLSSLAAQHGFSFNSSSVRKLKTRWGSCDSKKHITINIFLLQLPWGLIDYVLLHELTHTEHMHHHADFWERLEIACPDSKNLKKRLKQFRPNIFAAPDL